MMDSSWYDQKWNSSEGKMFDNFVPMFPEDVADQIVYCCTRPRHVQIADISSYATNQSYFSMKGVPPVARMGMSMGAENSNSDWSVYQQGWGDNMMGSRGNMMPYNQGNQGRNSPRGNMMHYPQNFNFGNNSPRSYGQNGSFGSNTGGSAHRSSSPYNGSGGRMGPNGSPYNSPRGSPKMGFRM
jgi:hypothetical protein